LGRVVGSQPVFIPKISYQIIGGASERVAAG
jgi:hypothetical protein